nr:unnamed protein product [Callosobruchus analis]
MYFADNQEFWTSFIHLYRKSPCLWNTKSRDYRDVNKRNYAYSELVAKCLEINPEADVKYVKGKIESLRNGLRRYQRQAKHSGWSHNRYQPKLWYVDLLLFLERDHKDGNEVAPMVSHFLFGIFSHGFNSFLKFRLLIY